MAQLYTYCKESGEIIGLLEFDEKPLYSTTKLYNGSYLKPMLNFETDEFYEGATTQELADAVKASIPLEIPLWRIRAILSLQDKENLITQTINSLEEPTKTAALYIWQFGTTIERNSNTVQFIQAVLQMSDEEVDTIFIQANSINL